MNLSFCTDDGTPLVLVDISSDEPTLVMPSPEGEPRSGEPSSQGQAVVPPYQPPGSYVPPVPQRKRRVWPWLLGILALVLVGLVVLGIAAAIIIPNMIRSLNTNTTNFNANVSRQDSHNSNLNSNSNTTTENENDKSTPEETSKPPADEQEVLADLTDLEHEWTVANINADKKALDRILADDYVGVSSEGKSQGKAEYLKTIERDTTIQKWDFDELKVSLKGDRATLTGIIRLQIDNQEVAYRFTDKFVWRDGRWQATSSEVSQVK